MNGNTGVEPLLGRDFAMRVLEAADHVVARRRRLRRTAGASAVCIGTAAIAVWFVFAGASQGPALDRKPLFAAASPPPAYNVSAGSPAGQASAPDALSYFFPDAEPLARYAAEDAGDDSGNSAGTLFADDE